MADAICLFKSDVQLLLKCHPAALRRFGQTRAPHVFQHIPSDADLLQKKDVSHVVRRILVQQSIDKPVSANDDLREIGLTSLDMVDLVLSVELEFNVRIPEAAITPANFRSIATIDALIKSLTN